MTRDAEGSEEGVVDLMFAGSEGAAAGAREFPELGEPVTALVAPLVAGVEGARLSTALAGRTISAHTKMTIGSSQSALRPGGDGDIAEPDEVS